MTASVVHDLVVFILGSWVGVILFLLTIALVTAGKKR